jgi:hypothetical protein
VNVGCHTDAHEQAKWFGDDFALKAIKYEHTMPSVGGGGAQLAELGPEAALEDGGVEVEHPFTLDDGVSADCVIADGQGRHLDLRAKLRKRLCDTALTLVHVNDDP